MIEMLRKRPVKLLLYLAAIVLIPFLAFLVIDIEAEAVYQSYLSITGTYSVSESENAQDVVPDDDKYIFCMPFTEKTTSISEMGYRSGNSAGNLHYADDLTVRFGEGKTVVHAVHPGTVTLADNWEHDDYGYQVKTYNKETGIECHYMHLFKPADVRVGDYLALGQPLGIMGNTGDSAGAHLHVEVKWHYAEGIVRHYSILQLAYRALSITEAEFWTRNPYGHYLGDGTPYMKDLWGSAEGNDKALGTDLGEDGRGWYTEDTGNWPQNFYEEN